MATARVGPLNLITDVAGLAVGHAQHAGVRSGVTVILPHARAICAVDVRGGAPGTRETDALGPQNLVDAVDAIVLAGGSVYGLGAADGVVAWLGEQGRGFGMERGLGLPAAPVVPAAVLFDLANGGRKDWRLDPPYRRLGIEAAEAAGALFALGTAGAAFGAMAGKLKGGLGSASATTGDGFTVGAVVAVNSFGSVTEPGSRAFWSAPFEIGSEFGGSPRGRRRVDPGDWGAAKQSPRAGENTTIACVATDAALTPAQAQRMAMMAHNGLARAIRPVHTPFDGDVVFAVATGAKSPPEDRDDFLARIGSLAADCLARAVARGVYEATPWEGSQALCWRDLPPDRD